MLLSLLQVITYEQSLKLLKIEGQGWFSTQSKSNNNLFRRNFFTQDTKLDMKECTTLLQRHHKLMVHRAKGQVQPDGSNTQLMVFLSPGWSLCAHHSLGKHEQTIGLSQFQIPCISTRFLVFIIARIPTVSKISLFEFLFLSCVPSVAL